jgi:hypothetical protein
MVIFQFASCIFSRGLTITWNRTTQIHTTLLWKLQYFSWVISLYKIEAPGLGALQGGLFQAAVLTPSLENGHGPRAA